MKREKVIMSDPLNHSLNRKCFVIMPFGNSAVDPNQPRTFDNIYVQWIKPAVEGFRDERYPGSHFVCHRADQSERPGEIISHIIENLVNADIVIADLTGQNANVFYELGVRHAVHNNTILIAQNIKDIPFDLRHLRTIEYSYTPDGMILFKNRLTTAIEAILTDTDGIDNPVRRYFYDKAVHDFFRQTVPPGFDAVRNMATELMALRRDFEQYSRQTRKIMESVTIPKIKDQVATVSSSDFEGIWRSSSGGIYCARFIDSRLFIPYSYYGDPSITGHYFDCFVFGQTIIGKFKWFSDPNISGYAYYQLVSSERLEGGWWYNEDVPVHIRSDLSKINKSIPGMTSVVWKKQPATLSFPAWAENYFNSKMYNKNSK